MKEENKSQEETEEKKHYIQMELMRYWGKKAQAICELMH